MFFCIQNKPPASTLFCSANSRSITIIPCPSMSQCFDCLINNMKDIPPMHFAVLFTVLYFSALSTSEDIFSLFTSMLSKQQFASSNFGSTWPLYAMNQECYYDYPKIIAVNLKHLKKKRFHFVFVFTWCDMWYIGGILPQIPLQTTFQHEGPVLSINNKHQHLHRRRISRIPLSSIACTQAGESIFQRWALSRLLLMDSHHGEMVRSHHQSCSSNFAANSTHTFEMLYKASLAFFVKIISHQQKKAVRQEKTMMARPPNRARTAGSNKGSGPVALLWQNIRIQRSKRQEEQQGLTRVVDLAWVLLSRVILCLSWTHPL